MNHYLVKMKNGRFFGVVAGDVFQAYQLGVEVIDQYHALDDDKEIEDVCLLDFFHKNGRVM